MSIFFKIFKKVAYTLRGRHLNRFYFVRVTLNFLLRSLGPKSVIVDGNRMILDKNDSMRLSILGIYEPLMVKLFQERIKPGSTVLDIGAHIGYYTLLAAKRVGSSGKVYAFEPNKENIALLSRNVKINGFKNVILVEKAVADSTKKQKLFLNPLSSGMHSLLDLGYHQSKENHGLPVDELLSRESASGGRASANSFDVKLDEKIPRPSAVELHKSSSSIMVDTVSLDEYFGKNPPAVSVIKMDIEGGEYAAVEGMSRLLRKVEHLTLFAEFSPFAIKRAKKQPHGFLKLLKSYGFKLYSIDESQNQLTPINLARFLSKVSEDRDWHVNLLAVK